MLGGATFAQGFRFSPQVATMTDAIDSNRASGASPPAGDEFDPATPIENPDQLRIAIDQGHGADKVDATDPAAAPLGTDDEAGGSPIDRSQVRLAAAYEIRTRPQQARQRRRGLGHACASEFLAPFTRGTLRPQNGTHRPRGRAGGPTLTFR